MGTQELIDRVTEHAAARSDHEGARLLYAVLRSLGELLRWREVEQLAAELPPRLATVLRDAEHGGGFDLRELVARVSRRTGAPPRVAIEHLTAVTSAIAGAVRADVLEPIRRDLPEPLARLFEAPQPRVSPPVHRHHGGRTLADGAPGGAQPLYAARPDAAHSESVARSDNPHGETKLSSARGLTQEREERTLASRRR